MAQWFSRIAIWTALAFVSCLGPQQAMALNCHDLFQASSRQVSGKVLRRLIKKAVAYQDVRQIPGGAGGVESLGKARGYYLRTSQIASSDLPYSNDIRPIDFAGLSKTEIPNITGQVASSGVFLVSEIHSGSAGVVTVGNFAGRPVAIKTYADPDESIHESNSFIFKEAIRLKLLSDLGIGPVFHGTYLDRDGRVGLVMDIVRGDFEHMKVTKQTFDDLQEIEDRMQQFMKNTAPPDLQIYRTQEGRLQVIDASAGNHPTDFDLKPDFDRQMAAILVEAERQIGEPIFHQILERDHDRFKSIGKFIKNISRFRSVPEYLMWMINMYDRGLIDLSKRPPRSREISRQLNLSNHLLSS